MAEKKERKVFYINHNGELLVWLLVLLIIVMFYSFYNRHLTDKTNEYNIFMPDVDGLIVGSSVRTMGIEVGYVTKIKPVKDEVYVKFIITDKSVTLPQGTTATVEFSGMAGSKSLELYLPDKNTYIDSTVPLIKVSSPKRLHDAYGMLNDMFKKIGDIITVSSRFGKNLGEIDFPEKNMSGGDSEKFLKYADNLIDNAQDNAEQFGRKIKRDDRK